MWNTPRTCEKGGYNQQKDGSHTLSLTGQATGEKVSKKKLNPNFVDWMQGLPIHWSDVTASIDSAAMETWRSRFRLRLRSLLSLERQD